MGRRERLHANRHLGAHGFGSRHLLPADRDQTYEKGETFPSMVGDVHFRPEDHQLVRPVIIVRGKKPSEMKNNEDFWEVLEVVPGAAVDAEAGRVRLPSRRLHLTTADAFSV
jgi:hypothetical protein